MLGGVGCREKSRMAAAASWTMMILAVAIWVSHAAEADHAETVHAAESSLSPDARALLALKAGVEDPNGALDDWVESVPSGSEGGGSGSGSGSRRRGRGSGSSISTSPCNWTAIECDSGGSVITLNLSQLNLTGNISGAIGSLAHLSTLSLDSNNFTGSIPGELSLLSHLRFFNITNNSFTSELPPGLSNLTRLEVLDCYNNYLSGPLPVELVALRNLKHVHLGGNNFQGSIPSAYGNLSTTLDYLSLSGNLLTGSIPPELGNLTSLTRLYLGWFNSFQGGIPRELGQLDELALLDLSSCQLTGRMPAELSNLSKLESLFFYKNNLSGPLPPEWGALQNLKSLDVSINNLVGPIPDSFGNMTSLTLLNVFENFLDGEMPPSLGDLTNLQVLQVWMNNLTGELPGRLGRTGSLVELDVSNNLLTGGLPPDLCHGGNLQILITKSNHLSGPIPDRVGSCSSLNYIRMHDNRLSGPIPASFFRLPSITMLQLQGNFFSGSIPSDMDAPLLRTVLLSQNQLEGSIPESVGNLSSLQTLHLGSNRLTGPIPSRICDMPALYEIELGSNALGGEIPASLGNCSALSLLDLSWNELTGPIPSSLVKLDVLAILDLSNNRLSGRILEGLGLIQSLTQVDFSYNNFSGPVPTSGNSQNYNESSYAGNPLLCGGEGLPSCASSNNSSNNSTSSSGGPNNNGTAPGGPERWTGKGGGPSLLAWLVGALFAVALVVLFVGVCCFCRRYKFHILRIFRKEGSGVRPWKFTPFQRLDFTAVEIVECLSEENIIGRGGAGTVYLGEMANGEMVAVKRLACQGKGTSSHDHGFSAEIRTLGKIRHRFIVRLLGFCTNNEINLLVYEYMPNGSLGEFLHDGKKSGLLDWTTRYNIALQAATGLCYLHHDCSPLIVHRDVKSNNILLDSNLEAHVADFGLAKLFQDSGKSESMSSIAGSYGYIAPEYAYTLKVNEKSDIYSFGVVLMELLTGKRPIESEFGDGVDIVQWVRLKIQTKEGVLEILDPRIGGTAAGAAPPNGGGPGAGTGAVAGDNGGLTAPVPLQEVMLVLRVALLCSSDHPADRPTMRDVVQMLSDVRPPVRTGSMDSRELKSQSSSAALTDDLLTF